jgi:hypothetical protein
MLLGNVRNVHVDFPLLQRIALPITIGSVTLRWKGHPEQRQRIQMVLLRESGMTQPSIAEARWGCR